MRMTLANADARVYFLVGYLEGNRLVAGAGYRDKRVSAEMARDMRMLSRPRSYDEMSAWFAGRSLLRFVTNDAVRSSQPGTLSHRLYDLRGLRVVDTPRGDGIATSDGRVTYGRGEDLPGLFQRLGLDPERDLSFLAGLLDSGEAHIEKVPRSRVRDLLESLADAHMGS